MSQIAAPLVSIVMAVYNGERFLRQAMDSILTQTFGDFELIVIDDASTDHTSEILDDYSDPRIVRMANARNLGQTRALNRGLSVAKGSLIARHDADDVSHCDRFRQQVEYLREHRDVGLLGTDYHLIDERGRILETVMPPRIHSDLAIRLEEGNVLCHGSVMMRKEALDQLDGYYDEGFRVTQDYDLWLRLAERCQIANLDVVLYNFRFDSESISRERRGLQLAYRRLALKRARQRRSGELPEEVPEDVLSAYPPEPERLLGDARRAAYLYYVAGQLESAAAMLSQAKEHFEAQESGAADWMDWAVAQGRVLSHLRGDPPAGAAFIRWVLGTLSVPGSERATRFGLGRFYADHAFLAAREGRKGRVVLPLVWNTVRHDWRWLRNRGIWAISLRSFW